MRRLHGLVSFVMALVISGCSSTTTDEQKPGGPGVTPRSNKELKPGAPGVLTPESMSIGFVGTKPGGKHEGGFEKFSGTIAPIQSDFTACIIKIDIETESVFSDDAKLTNHLKAPDFFDVKKYPTASFVSTGIKAEASGDATYVVTGELTLHGATNSISVPAKVTLSDDLLTLDATFKIDRTQFGIAYDPRKVDKDVTVKIAAKVARK